MKKLDLNALAEALRNAHLKECLTGECQCITMDEHERNVARAKELGLVEK